jgi:hypothetical protein
MQECRRTSTEEAAAPTEEGFEDVGLNDEPKPTAPKKKGLFARFGDSHHADGAPQEERSGSSHLHFNFTGRKRAQSGQGSELKSMQKPATTQPTTEVA